jgi:hypothetical protein
MSGSVLGPIRGFQRNLDDPAGVNGSERRRGPRTVLTNLAYIHLEPDSGAIVLNVSEGGLGFHAVAPVRQTGIIRFWCSMKPDERVEASGEVAWTDESKKTGGLRFTHLSEGAQEQIQRWIGQATTSTPDAAKSPEPRPEVFEYLPKLSSVAPVGPDGEQDHESARAYFDLTASQMSAEARSGPAALPSLFWQAPTPEMPVLRSQPKFARGFAAGVLVSLVVAAAFLAYSYPGQVGRLIATASQNGMKSAPPSEPLPTAPPPVPGASDAAATKPADTPITAPATSSSNPSSSLPSSSPLPSSPPQRDLEPQATVDPRGAAQQPSALGRAQDSVTPSPRDVEQVPSEDDGSEPDMIAAERYLHGPGGARNTAAAIRFLWAAIEKGNSTAEIMLADLYARGDGVPKNCAQARVLLIAAAGKGNLEARQRLQDLNGKGCY